MKNLLLLSACISLLSSCSYMRATFMNRNVYKTQSNLVVTKAYSQNGPSKDSKQYLVVPKEAAVSQDTTSNDNVSFTRYKVVNEEGDYKYIRLLPQNQFKSEGDTNIVHGKPGTDNPGDYIFQVSKKALTPNTHYLASSALIGKVITIPARIRKEYWNDNNTTLQGTLSVGYGFGWKYKIGNHPYRSHYLSTILYAAGISQQKYFTIVGSDPTSGKAIISEKKDEIAVTYLSFGIAYEFERFNVGVFAGKDKMFGSLKNWVYQDKWWWGIGVGYELFK